MKAFFFLLSFAVLFATGKGQADRIVATVRIPVPGAECLTTINIRASDMLTQLALQPNTKLDPPAPEDLNRALDMVIDQQLLLYAARAEAPYFKWFATEDDIRREIEQIIQYFPSSSEFERRIKHVGFASIKDEDFASRLRDRWLIGKYIDVGFRSTNRPTEEQEKRYYDEVFVPEFRKINPGLIVPTFEDAQGRVSAAVTELRVESALEEYLERRKRTAKIAIYE